MIGASSNLNAAKINAVFYRYLLFRYCYILEGKPVSSSFLPSFIYVFFGSSGCPTTNQPQHHNLLPLSFLQLILSLPTLLRAARISLPARPNILISNFHVFPLRGSPPREASGCSGGRTKSTSCLLPSIIIFAYERRLAFSTEQELFSSSSLPSCSRPKLSGFSGNHSASFSPSA